MRPLPSSSDVANCGLTKSKLLGNILLLLSSFQSLLNLKNNVFRYSGHSMLAADVSKSSPFSCHIVHVVLMGSAIKMLRIYARPIITFMKNLKPFWNHWKFTKHVRHSMGGNNSHCSVRRFKNKSSVTFFEFGCRPLPTFSFGFLAHFRPKSLFSGFNHAVENI